MSFFDINDFCWVGIGLEEQESKFILDNSNAYVFEQPPAQEMPQEMIGLGDLNLQGGLLDMSNIMGDGEEIEKVEEK